MNTENIGWIEGLGFNLCHTVKHVILICFSADDPLISPVAPQENYDEFSNGAKDDVNLELQTQHEYYDSFWRPLGLCWLFLFSPIDFYESNFPNLPDDPLSKENLETSSVLKNLEPTQAILPDMDGTDLTKPFTQDNADPDSGYTSTVSPQTEVVPTFPSEKQPIEIDAIFSPSDPSDHPPTGTNAWPYKAECWSFGPLVLTSSSLTRSSVG